MLSRKDWKEIIYKDGKIDEEQVMKELEDYAFLMEQASKVYCAVTNGKMSKTNYFAHTIIQEYEQSFDDYVHKDDIRDLIK